MLAPWGVDFSLGLHDALVLCSRFYCACSSLLIQTKKALLKGERYVVSYVAAMPHWRPDPFLFIFSFGPKRRSSLAMIELSALAGNMSKIAVH